MQVRVLFGAFPCYLKVHSSSELFYVYIDQSIFIEKLHGHLPSDCSTIFDILTFCMNILFINHHNLF